MCWDLLMLLTVLILWMESKSFKKLLLDSSSNFADDKRLRKVLMKPISWIDIEKSYLKLKNQCQLINSSFGTILLLFMIGDMLYFALTMYQILVVHANQQDIHALIPVILVLWNGVMILLLSADIPYNV